MLKRIAVVAAVLLALGPVRAESQDKGDALGFDLVAKGVEDLAAGRQSVPALLAVRQAADCERSVSSCPTLTHGTLTGGFIAQLKPRLANWPHTLGTTRSGGDWSLSSTPRETSLDHV